MLEVQLVTLQDCRKDFEQAPAVRNRARFRLPLWRAGEPPQLAGPEFEGTPPFPFDPSPV